ncbi:MAG: Pyoverdine chromophore precursor synthetase PvdL [Myxococcaceae bacterium]|nr:Pyoverdine chromophore precursor synthetase PvdL [Myxococcaceae bacterium]
MLAQGRMRKKPSTLVEALAALPRGTARGFRFLGADGQERYFPYEALEAEALRRAGLLAQAGIEKADRVALVIPEGHEFVLSFLGVVLAGAVPVPIFPRATFKVSSDYTDTVRHIAAASESRLLLAMEANRALIEPVLAEGAVPATLQQLATVEGLFAPERVTDGAFTQPELTGDDLCFLQFTSGSTSRPKGVMVSHRNLIANATAFLGPEGLDRRDDDVGVSWLPLFHDMGLIGFILGPLIMDIPVVILPTASFARGPKIWLETITKHRGSITYAPNFAYALATKRLKAKDVAALDLSCLRIAGCGAEPIQAATLRDFAAALAPAGLDPTALLPSYGMAEATLAITFHQRGHALRTDKVDPVAMRSGRAEPSTADDALELVSCGRSFPEHELAIFDEQGARLPERRVGEIVVRGPSVSSGYFHNPEANAQTFPSDGFLHTGDLGYLADGDLFICGRSKDLIIIRGANFYPQDLEWAVSELEGVRRGNVVAFSTQLEGEERLVLAVECSSSDAASVQARVASRVTEAFGLAPHEVVAVTLGGLPKTSSGKVQRKKTRDLYEGGQLDRH